MIQWTSEYAIGHRLIDVEHKTLFDIAQEVSAAPFTKLSQFKAIYLDIGHYITMHFLSEEAMMKDINYSGLLTHMNSHRKIQEEIRQMLVGKSSLKELQDSLEQNMHKWLVNHILREDMAYKPVYHSWRESRII